MKHCFEQFAVVKIFTELPSKQLPVLSKKKKYYKKVWNMLKVNNKDTIITLLTSYKSLKYWDLSKLQWNLYKSVNICITDLPILKKQCFI